MPAIIIKVLTLSQFEVCPGSVSYTAGLTMAEDAAMKRVNQRFAELVETEAALHESIKDLQDHIAKVVQDKRWQFKPEQSNLLQRASNMASNLMIVHQDMLENLMIYGNSANSLAQTFESMAGKFVGEYTAFQSLAILLVLVLQKKSGGQVKGDSAVGSGSTEQDGSLASDAALGQDLASRPTLRVLRYQVYLDEMATDAAKAGNDALAQSLRKALETVKRMNMEINEGVRKVQRRERVRLIAGRLRAVPDGIPIDAHGREFIMDNDKFIEEGREGYRNLYLFNDSILVVKATQGIAGKLLGTRKDTDLKFKRLISLRGLTPDICPEVIEPPKGSASPGGGTMRASMPSFCIVQKSMNGKDEKIKFFGSREVITEWVHQIKLAVATLAVSQEQGGPVPAWRLPANGERSHSMLPPTEDLAGLDITNPHSPGVWLKQDMDDKQFFLL